jgi:ribose transport system ATP-binding protein
MTQREGEPLLSLRNWSKTFSGRTVLSNVDLDIYPGEIHGLIGQNGSGKSTLIKILSAFHAPDAGATLELMGKPVTMPLKARDPADFGISFVHQDLGLIDRATVVENVSLAKYDTGFLWYISWRQERKRVVTALRKFGVYVEPYTLVQDLEPVDRAQIAIVRALERLTSASGGILVLDEPTPHLPRDGVERLFKSIRSIASAGFGVLFVTHRLDEIRELTNWVTILRDGKRILSEPTASLTDEEIRNRLLGFTLDRLYPSETNTVEPEPAATFRDVSSKRVKGFNLNIRKGEIVGLTGLLQQGWEEIPYLVFGALAATGGTLVIGGRTRDLTAYRPSQAIEDGFALVPAARLEDGAVGAATVRENLTLTTLARDFVGGRLRHGREAIRTKRLLQEYDVRPPDPDRTFSTLSGGNQQKVVLAKWFETEPTVLLLHEPTQGVDVGARSQIYKRLRQAASTGLAVLIASAEFEDLAHVCDRVIVIQDGVPRAELTGPSLTYERIVEQCFGQAHQSNGQVEA